MCYLYCQSATHLSVNGLLFSAGITSAKIGREFFANTKAIFMVIHFPFTQFFMLIMNYNKKIILYALWHIWHMHFDFCLYEIKFIIFHFSESKQDYRHSRRIFYDFNFWISTKIINSEIIQIQQDDITSDSCNWKQLRYPTLHFMKIHEISIKDFSITVRNVPFAPL